MPRSFTTPALPSSRRLLLLGGALLLLAGLALAALLIWFLPSRAARHQLEIDHEIHQRWLAECPNHGGELQDNLCYGWQWGLEPSASQVLARPIWWDYQRFYDATRADYH